MNSFEYECALKWCHRGISKYPKSEIMLETCGNVMLENGQTDNGIKISFILKSAICLLFL